MCLFFIPLLPIGSAAQNEPDVRIGLLTGQFNVLMSANTDADVFDADGKLLQSFAPGVKFRIGLREGRLVVNDKESGSGMLRVVNREVKIIKDQPSLEVNNRRYRGMFEVFRTPGKNGITVVNVVPVEGYVYGIIKREISPEWPMEAIKAQAVAARTYALFNLGKHKDEGFDLCATSDCQVYGGIGSEDVQATQAVNDTRGVVMTYNGNLVAAFFHASSGGYTENSENVWTIAYPYLKGVPDFDQMSPYFRWQKLMTPQEIETTLQGAGYNIGRLTAVEISRLKKQPMIDSHDRGVSGRVRNITFIGTNGIATVEGTKIRNLLSLQSTLFDIKIAVPMGDIESNITDSYGDRDTKKIEINLPPTQSTGLPTDKEGIWRITGRKNEMVYIDGYGWGHGLGLSQWGAKAMAEKAVNPVPNYYMTILKHYYQGVNVEKRY